MCIVHRPRFFLPNISQNSSRAGFYEVRVPLEKQARLTFRRIEIEHWSGIKHTWAITLLITGYTIPESGTGTGTDTDTWYQVPGTNWSTGIPFLIIQPSTCDTKVPGTRYLIPSGYISAPWCNFTYRYSFRTERILYYLACTESWVCSILCRYKTFDPI